MSCLELKNPEIHSENEVEMGLHNGRGRCSSALEYA
jgi:hypothetical protein